jgi:acyl carrier protein
MQEVLQSKAMGGWHLHQLTLDLPLDFFILYSSAASLLGSAGQGSHVAANAFLDALAHQRRALGLPAQSLNWGGWSQIGSAAGASTERELAKRGISMISPVQGIRALALAIQRPDLAQVGIIPADWEGLARAGLSCDPFFSEVMQGATAGQLLDKRVSVVDDGGGWLEEFNTLPIGQRENYLIRKIREELAEVIGLPEGALPSAEAGFFDLGVDSLMSVDLKNRLTRALGIEISPTMIFQHPNIKALSVRLIGILGTPKKKAAPTNLEKVEVSDSSIAEELAALEDLLD